MHEYESNKAASVLFQIFYGNFIEILRAELVTRSEYTAIVNMVTWRWQ